MFNIIVVQNYSYKLLDITTTDELREFLSGLENPNALVILNNEKDDGSVYYTDIRMLFAELPPSTIPDTIEELTDSLTDMQYDGYRISNPVQTITNVLVSKRLSEMDRVKAESCDINHPNDRKDLIYGDITYPDLVLSATDTSMDVSNLVIIKDGKAVRTQHFNDELYVENIVEDLTNDNHVILNLNDIGGCEVYFTNELEWTNYDDGYTVITLPSGRYLTAPPFIVLDGILYDLGNLQFKVYGANALKISHDFHNAKTPGDRQLYPDVSDDDWPSFHINQSLQASNSMLIVPKGQIYYTRHKITPINDHTYIYRTPMKYIAGILMLAWNNYICPFKILSSTRDIKTGIYSHIIKIHTLHKSLSMDEVQLDPDQPRLLNEPYNQNARNDVRFIHISS